MSVIITGAASGLGAALTNEFLEKQQKVIGLDRFWPEVSEESESLTKPEQGNLIKIAADLANHETFPALIETLTNHEPVEALIHNAAISATGPFEAIPASSHQQLIDVNFTAPLLLTKRLIATGALKKGSSIVFIASLSVHVGYPGALSYAASKAGLANYAKSLRKALKKDGIHVMTVYPGPMKTAQASRHAPNDAKEESRMPPQNAAQAILTAMKKKKSSFIPGTTNKVFALAGKAAPSLLDKAMRKIIYDKLEKPVYENKIENENKTPNQ